MKIRALAAAALAAALSLPTLACADTSAPVNRATVELTLDQYCSPPGPRRALSLRHRAQIRQNLARTREAHPESWRALPDDLRQRADDVINRRSCE
ncbi:MAG TPA: hypothetical protein VEB18_03035 [Candidatus Paceibacterota bacterium]|nr:hypothetical protein [Candidatus Paceibacterota bacterium]